MLVSPIQFPALSPSHCCGKEGKVALKYLARFFSEDCRNEMNRDRSDKNSGSLGTLSIEALPFRGIKYPLI